MTKTVCNQVTMVYLATASQNPKLYHISLLLQHNMIYPKC